MVKAKKWTMVKAWDKAANMSNFKLEEETLPDTLGKGGNYYVILEHCYILCKIYKTVYLFNRLTRKPVV